MGNTPGPFQGFVADSQPKLPSPVSLPNPVGPEMGLGGQPQGAQGDLTGQQPEPPQPHETVARHILDALGGANPNDKMGWAKSVISGGLAAAANVGKVPEGAGWLAGASRGAQGVVELKRQQEQDALRKQAQQQEMQLKQNADVRAQKELEIHLEDTKVQRALYTAQIAGMTQQQNQAEAKFEEWKKTAPLEYEKARQEYQTAQDKIDEAHGEMKGLVEAVTGKPLSSFPLIKNSSDLTEDHAKQAADGSIFPVHNGEKHSAGEDGVGVHLIPGDVWEKPIPKPFSLMDPNNEKVTAQTGTTLATLAGVIAGKMKAAQNEQTQVMNKLDVQAKQAQIAHENAETQNAILSGQLLKKQMEDPDSLTPKEAHQLQKAGQTESSKTQKDYNTFLQSANSIEGSIRASKDGNELASAIIPLQGTLFITTAEGVKRINQTELAGVAGSGDIVRRGENAYLKFVEGDTSEGTKRDLANLIEVYKKAKYQQYLNNEDVTAKNYRLGDKQTVFDINGKPTNLGEARAKLATESQQVPVGGVPILKDGKTVGFIINGERTDF